MKSFFFIVCLFFTAVVSADGLHRSDIVGIWKVAERGSPGRSSNLTVHKDFSASFKHNYSKNLDNTFKASPNSLRKYDGAWSIKFVEKNQSLSYKLVFSGWKNRKTKSMFGVLYVYQYGVLYNGLSVSFDQPSLP